MLLLKKSICSNLILTGWPWWSICLTSTLQFCNPILWYSSRR